MQFLTTDRLEEIRGLTALASERAPEHASRQYNEVKAELRQLLAVRQGNLTATQELGMCYLVKGRFLDAIPLFRKAFDMTRDPRFANGLGMAYFNLDRMNEAIPVLRDAYRLDPSPDAARNLAESYEKIGQEAESRRWYALAIDRFDSMPDRGASRAELLDGRSFCAAKLGRYDEALGDIQEAMRLRPGRNSFLFRMAQILAMAGRREEAYDYARQAMEKGYPGEEVRRDRAFRDFQFPHPGSSLFKSKEK